MLGSNILIQHLALYADPESHNAEGKTDGMMMPIDDHTV